MSQSHRWWAEAAGKAGVDLTGFDPVAPLGARIAWAVGRGLSIGVAYSRYSTKKQGSTEDQIRSCLEHAAKHGIYVPAEFVCADEAQKGRKQKRPGLARAESILQRKMATVLLIFKLSRLNRMAHQTIRFFREVLVDQGLRGISVTESIDTAEGKTWRLQAGMRGLMDEELLDAIGDHVREGLTGLFLRGWTTGALAVGYYPKEVPGGPKTRRNLVRTMPAVDEKTAALIRRHFQMAADGQDITGGWRQWRAEGGPADPRSTTGTMSYSAYIRLLQREAYTGRWPFCRKRNQWSAARDMVEQIVQPDSEVTTLCCEELRIVDDQLFLKVQERLTGQKIGPRPKHTKDVYHLWDLVISVHVCPHCQRRLHMAGAGGHHMRCPCPECPAKAMINRENAVVAECAALTRGLREDAGFVDQVLASFAALNDQDRDTLDEKMTDAERRGRQLANRMRDLEDLLGEGSEEDRQRRKGQIKAAEAERAGVALELEALRRQRGGGKSEPVTRAQVEYELANLLTLLDDAVAGKLGTDVAKLAADVFRRLVGGSIEVRATRRPARKDWIVTGVFTPDLLGTVRQALGASGTEANPAAPPLEVFLVAPPFVDQMADEAQQLYDAERLGFRKINELLEAKYGKKIGTGNVCAARRRWYQIRGLPVPPVRPGGGGRPRKAA